MSFRRTGFSARYGRKNRRRAPPLDGASFFRQLGVASESSEEPSPERARQPDVKSRSRCPPAAEPLLTGAPFTASMRPVPVPVLGTSCREYQYSPWTKDGSKGPLPESAAWKTIGSSMVSRSPSRLCADPHDRYMRSRVCATDSQQGGIHRAKGDSFARRAEGPVRARHQKGGAIGRATQM